MAINYPQGYDDDFINIIKKLIDHVTEYGKTIQDLVAEGQLTEEQYSNLITTINGMLKSGEVDRSDLNTELRAEVDKVQNKIDKGDVSVHDINKNLGKFDQTYMSEEFLQQIVGTTEINATPAYKGVTRDKIANKAITTTNVDDFIKGALRLRTVQGDTFSWHMGSLSTSNGSVIWSNTISIVTYKTEIENAVIRLVDEENFNMTVFMYTLDGDFIKGAPIGSSDTFEIKEKCNVRILLRYKDEREIADVDDVPKDVVEVDFTTDVGLDSLDDSFKSILSLATVNGDITDWEHGGLSVSDGSLGTDDNTRIRSDFIAIRGAVITAGENAKVSVYKYDKNSNFIDYTGFSEEPIYINEQIYIKVIMAYKDDRVIEDIEGLGDTLRIKGQSGTVTPYKEVENGNDQDVTPSHKLVFADELTGLYRIENPHMSNIWSGQSSEMHSLYDELVTNYPNYVSKKVLGDDSVGNEIVKYSFKSNNIQSSVPIRKFKVYITTGTHGNEKSPVQSMFSLFKKMCENWRDDSILEFLRFNVDFHIIPVVNPSGYNNHSRENVNDIDLNRDFPNEGAFSESDHSHRELETQIILEEMKQHADDVHLWVDFHNMYFRDGYMSYVTTPNSFLNELSNKTIHQMGRVWQKDYPLFPQEEDHEFGYTTPGTSNTVQRGANGTGIPALTLEIVRHIEWQEEWEQYDELTIKAGTDLFVNLLSNIIKNMSK